jgi:hypothetical protein
MRKRFLRCSVCKKKRRVDARDRWGKTETGLVCPFCLYALSLLKTSAVILAT